MSENGSLRFVVGLNALASGYDANGNMTLRLKDGARYFLAYDAENRLKTVSGTVSASFVYNGDGQRVASTISTTTTAYIGGHFEWQAGSGTSCYFAGAQRVAMRTSTGVKYLLGDHLGSTAVIAYANGAFDTETRYYPWGGVRWSYGAPPTDYQFTGHQNVASIGLYFYNARFYDAQLGRFVSPDTIIPRPGNPISFDRYAYVLNAPINHTDPTGHCDTAPGGHENDADCWNLISQIQRVFGVELINDMLMDITNLRSLWRALRTFRDAVGAGAFEMLKGMRIGISSSISHQSPGTIMINIAESPADFRASVIHEITHEFLRRLGDRGIEALDQFRDETGWTCSDAIASCNPLTGPTRYSRNQLPDYYTRDPNDTIIVNAEEDLADSLAVYLEPSSSHEYELDADRRDFLENFFADMQRIKPNHRK